MQVPMRQSAASPGMAAIAALVCEWIANTFVVPRAWGRNRRLDMMMDEVRLVALRASKLAADLSEDEYKVLAGLVDVRELTDGEVLVQEGAADDHLYVVAAGHVGVVKYRESDTPLTVAYQRRVEKDARVP